MASRRFFQMSFRGITVAFVIALIVAIAVAMNDPASHERPSQLKVFLLAGQSNMAGADALINGNGASDLAGSGLQKMADRNTLFTYGLAFAESGPFYYPWGDIRGYRGSSHGAVDPPVYVQGPEVGFARVLYAAAISNVAIIKVATNFQKLENGRSPWVKPNSVYQDWRNFVSHRLAELKQKNYSYSIEGFLWQQGIDDAILGRSEQAYEADLRQIIKEARADYATPNTPFILARSVNSVIAGPQKMAPIRAAQVAVAQSDPLAAWINVDDLTPYVNRHHLTAASQLISGERFGRAYLKLKGLPASGRKK